MKTKTKYLLISLVGMFLFTACGNQELNKQISESKVSENIRVNQLGYFPSMTKQFTLAEFDAESFYLVNQKGRVVLKGDLTDWGEWKPSAEKLKSGDFSSIQKTGKYFIHIPELGNSFQFIISDTIYQTAAKSSIESFYFMRASMDMEEKYLGKFARPAGHPDDTAWFHPSSGYSEGFISSPGGWYDAGDYGKYVVNASIACGTMLALNELMPHVFADGSLDIPENGNGVNDLLDEIRYELEWVLTMQDKDGGVFHKLSSQYHDGITMPVDTHSKRLIIGKPTGASLDFAAIMAQAARSWETIDTDFSEKCLEAAKLAYEWALANPNVYFSNPPDIGTGPYNDKILDEEFFWSAAELFSTTGDERYYEEIKLEIANIRFRLEESWRNYVDNIGYYSLYMSDKLNEDDRIRLEAGIVRLADKLLSESFENPYNIPITRFVWGSNSDVLNTAIIQVFAYEVTKEKKYLDAAAGFTDYIFGRNATAYSFVSGFGTKYSRNFHHRLLMADDNEETFPGFIAGGPNFQMQDAADLRSQNVEYTNSIPAKAYIDHDGSYASNEVCINWNAPLVFMLGYLDGISLR